jgi:Niemann-Pick C1 protein
MKMALADRFGLAMKHAGVAITITSVTDLMAFGIGATTVLPALRSFCVYSSLGIFFVFIYMVTFFVAFFSLDQRRIESDHDGCVCCYQHKEYKPNACSQISILDMMFLKYSKVVIKLPFKIVVIVMTVLPILLAIFGCTQLKEEFKFTWFLEEGTYLRSFIDEMEAQFPSSGFVGEIWVADHPDIHTKIKELDTLIIEYFIYLFILVHNYLQMPFFSVSKLSATSLSDVGVKSFLPDLITFMNSKSDVTDYPNTAKDMSMDKFQEYLSQFICSSGRPWKNNFKFKNDATLECGKNAPELLAITFDYKHRFFISSIDMIKAMNEVVDMLNERYDILGGKGRIFAHSAPYADCITMEIITTELYRNIILAIVAIFIGTIILLADLVGSLMVLLSVVFTVVDVGGFMHFWGLTIDTSSALLLTV